MQKSNWQYFDWWLLILVLALTIVGVAMIYSATLDSESLADLWRKQALYGAIGLVLLFITAMIDRKSVV